MGKTWNLPCQGRYAGLRSPVTQTAGAVVVSRVGASLTLLLRADKSKLEHDAQLSYADVIPQAPIQEFQRPTKHLSVEAWPCLANLVCRQG